MLSVGAAPAFAYKVTRVAPTVVRIERDLSEDGTATGNVVVWTSPKSVAYASYQYTSSFNTNLTFTSLMGSQVRSVEVTVPADALCLVEVGAGTTQKNLFQPVAPFDVSGSVTATVTSAPAFPSSITATISAMPTVSVGSSMSVEGTLPVNVADIPPGLWATSGLAVVLIGATLSLTIMRGRRGR